MFKKSRLIILSSSLVLSLGLSSCHADVVNPDVDTSIKGETGNGIKEITIKSSTDTETVYTITFTDGSTYDYTVKNGKDGTDGKDGADGKDGTNGEKSETFTITFHLDGGSVPTDWLDSSKVNNNDTIIQTIDWGDTLDLPVLTKAGYTFNGWFTLSNDVNNPTRQWYSTDAVFTNLDLYPSLDILTYNISYDLDGGTLLEDNPSTYTVEDTFTLNNPTKEGSTFLGWTCGNEEEPSTNMVITNETGDKEYVANWQANTYTVSLDSNGEECSTSSIDVTYGSQYTLPTLSKDGYVFDGWYYGDTEISSDGIWNFTEDMTLVAKFSSYTYTLNSDGESYTFSGLDSSKAPSVITIPSTYNGLPVNAIGNSAFAKCSNLTAINLPNSITSIGNYAFYNCSSLKSIEIPESVTNVGNHMLTGCSSLEELILPNMFNKRFSYFFGSSENSNDSSYIPISLKSVTINGGDIPDYAFSYLWSLNFSLILGDEVTSIGNYAFEYWYSLTSIAIPDSATSIGDYAFQSCSRLNSVTIPDNVTSIGCGVFDGCSSLQYNEYENGLYLGNDNNPYICLVKAKDPSITKFKINENAKFIYSYAFNECSSLDSIVIPDSVISIGHYAFNNCSSLTSITIPDSVTSVEERTFCGCSSLTSITIPNSVTSIGQFAFGDCTSLISIDIPNSVTSLGTFTFCGCSSLEELALPSLFGERLGYYFGADSTSSNSYSDGYIAKSLKKVTISSGDITSYAFEDYSSLVSINIPNNATSIGWCAFNGCSSLTSIIIPNSVTTIGSRAFNGCSSLNNVCYEGTAEMWNKISISYGNDVLNSDTIYYYSESEPTTTGNYWHYVDGVATPWNE